MRVTPISFVFFTVLLVGIFGVRPGATTEYNDDTEEWSHLVKDIHQEVPQDEEIKDLTPAELQLLEAQAEEEFRNLEKVEYEKQYKPIPPTKSADQPIVGLNVKDTFQPNLENIHKSRDRIPTKNRRNSFGDEFGYSADINKGHRIGLSAHGNVIQQELEKRLIPELLEKNVFEAQRRQQEALSKELEEENDRNNNYLYPRAHARPVEKILQTLDNGGTWYQIMGLRQGVDAEEIKRKYKSLAKLLHPDKNPHPLAKNAFDAVQDAYDILIHPATRVVYDNELRRRPKLLRRCTKSVSEFTENTYARSMLLLKRLRTGEWHVEARELKQWLVSIFSAIYATLRTIIKQPTMKDRIYMAMEVVWDNKLRSAAVVSAALLLFRL